MDDIELAQRSPQQAPALELQAYRAVRGSPERLIHGISERVLGEANRPTVQTDLPLRAGEGHRLAADDRRTVKDVQRHESTYVTAAR